MTSKKILASFKSTFSILVTGGAGYIGSHTVLNLLQENCQVVVVDNCSAAYVSNDIDSNGNIDTFPESLKRVQRLTNKKLLAFYNLDLVTDEPSGKLDEIFIKHNVGAVIHFAAFKVVSESIARPLDYYTNNIVASINLLNCMKRNRCFNLIFSSSATVYGLPQYLPVDEKHPVGNNVLNPYGRTKCMVETILKDLCNSKWNIISLRYFNPVGAHPSGLIGEHACGAPNNLMPYISQVAIRKRDKVYIFGNDYDTVDGTGVRDYIHIMDLAAGHFYALKSLVSNNHLAGNYRAYNLGTGRGYSVLETIRTYAQVNNVEIAHEFVGRREGDAGSVYADVTLASKELDWSAKLGLIEMCRDAHRWQVNCPDGYKSQRLDF